MNRQALAQLPGADVIRRDGTAISWFLLGTGAFAAVVGLWIESSAGLLASWDRWMLPGLAVCFGAMVLWDGKRPQDFLRIRLAGITAVNLYFLVGLHLTLFTPGGYSHYLFTRNMIWLPLGYASAFVYLPTRHALITSLGVFASAFLPILTALVIGQPAQWSPSMATEVASPMLAHLTSVVLLLAVSVLRRRADEAERELEAAQAIATTDALTGLANRRGLDRMLTAQIALAQRTGGELSMTLIDVDHFKSINDSCGHAAGDRVLESIARILMAELRGSDTVGRWGGDEFVVISPGTPLKAAAEMAERTRSAVEGTRFGSGSVTLSLGVTQFLAGDDIHALLRRADLALYRAKQRSRNCVETEAGAATG